MSGLIDVFEGGLVSKLLDYLSPELPKHLEFKKYADIKKTLKTGDIVLINGTTAMLKALGRSPFCHVGMIIKKNGKPYLWESTYGWEYKNKDSVIAGKADGVHLIDLWEAMTIESLAKYCIRPLILPNTLDQASFEATIQKVINTFAGRPYEQCNWELLMAGYDGMGGHNKKNLESIFCSELIAETFQQLGLLPEHIPSNEYTPLDFSSVSKKQLQLLNGASFTQEYVIDLTGLTEDIKDEIEDDDDENGKKKKDKKKDKGDKKKDKKEKGEKNDKEDKKKDKKDKKDKKKDKE